MRGRNLVAGLTVTLACVANAQSGSVQLSGFAPSEEPRLCALVLEALALSRLGEAPTSCGQAEHAVWKLVVRRGHDSVSLRLEHAGRAPGIVEERLEASGPQVAGPSLSAAIRRVVAAHLSATWVPARSTVPEEAVKGSTPPAPQVEPARTADPLGAVLLTSAMLGVGSGWYLLTTSAQQEDWEYDYSFRTLERKFSGEGIRFDDNPLYLNSPGHALAGTAYYSTGRMHGLAMPSSFALATAASLTWELTTEFREIVSINDLIITSVGGLALGEPLAQLSWFFQASESTPWNTLLGDAFGLPTSLEPTWRRPAGLRLLDNSGHPRDVWYVFTPWVGLSGMRNFQLAARSLSANAGVNAKLLARADYERAGTLTDWFLEPLFVELRAGASVGTSGLSDVELLGEVVYAGLYAQDIAGSGAELWGAAWYVGSSAHYEHREQLALPPDDQLGSTALAGLSAHLALHLGRVHLRCYARLHPVFAAIRSYDYLASPYLAAPRSLERHGYYYGLGLRTEGTGALEYRGTAVGVGVWGLGTWATEPLRDRGTGAAVPLSDTRINHWIWVSQALPYPGLSLRMALEERIRGGVVETQVAGQRDWRVDASLQFGH